MAMISRSKLKAAMLAVKPQPKRVSGPPAPKVLRKSTATAGPFSSKIAAFPGLMPGGNHQRLQQTATMPKPPGQGGMGGGMPGGMGGGMKPPMPGGGMKSPTANMNSQIAMGGNYGGASVMDASHFDQQGALPPQMGKPEPPQTGYEGARNSGSMGFGQQNFIAGQGDLPETQDLRPHQPLGPGEAPHDMPPADHFAHPSRGMQNPPPAEPERSPGASWADYKPTNAPPPSQAGGSIPGFMSRLFGGGGGGPPAPAKSQTMSPATTDNERMLGRNKYLYGQPGSPGLNKPGPPEPPPTDMSEQGIAGMPGGQSDMGPGGSEEFGEQAMPEEGLAGNPPGGAPDTGPGGSGEDGAPHDPNNPYAFQAGPGADMFQGGEEPPPPPQSPAAAAPQEPTSPVSAQRSPPQAMSPGTQRMQDKNQVEMSRLQDLMLKNPQSQHLRQHLQGRIDALGAQNQLYGHIGGGSDADAAEMMGGVPDVRPAPMQQGQPQKPWWQTEEQFSNAQAPPGPGKTQMAMKGAAAFVDGLFGKSANLYGQPGNTASKINQPKLRTQQRERFKQRIKLPLPNEPEKAASSTCKLTKMLKNRRMKKKADAEDPLLARMMGKGKMDKGKAVAIAKSRGWIHQSGRHLELSAAGKSPRNNAAKHIRQEGGSTKLSAAASFVERLLVG